MAVTLYSTLILQLVKKFIVKLWEQRKQKLYGSLSSGPCTEPLIESRRFAIIVQVS